jgi:hypothetical protein
MDVGALLTVVLENLVAGRADLGAIFLEACQDGEVALVDDWTAVLLDVAGTGLLLLRCSAPLLLRECCLRRDRDRQQGESQERFTHRIPSFRQQETLFPICTFGIAGTDLLGWQCRVTQRRAEDKHGKCGQIYGDIYGDLSTLNNQLIFKVYFCHTCAANSLLRTMLRVARCCADRADESFDSSRLPAAFYPASGAGNNASPFEPKILQEH